MTKTVYVVTQNKEILSIHSNKTSAVVEICEQFKRLSIKPTHTKLSIIDAVKIHPRCTVNGITERGDVDYSLEIVIEAKRLYS